MNNEIIVVKQLPQIEEHLQTIKEDVTKRVNEATSLVCTEETVKVVKEYRAQLNREFKYWEDERKKVKKAVMSPYDQFEAVYKSCITDVFKKGDADLKNKIDSVERDLKREKEDEVIRYFDEYVESKNKGLQQFITYRDTNINVTLSASLKSLKEQAKAFVDRVCDDLVLIETQEHKDEILYEYKQTLNVANAITTVTNRYKAIEAARKREEERKAKELAAKEAAKKVETVVEPLAPPVESPRVEEKVLTVKLTIRATKSKLSELKAFLNSGGYEYYG